MATYHVGCGLTEIYAGTLNKNGTQWINKSVVTDEAIKSVAQFLYLEDESFLFTIHGKRCRLSVTEVKE